MTSSTTFCDRPEWYRSSGAPGSPITALCARYGNTAFLVGVQAGYVDRRDRRVWHPFLGDDSPGFLWTAFSDHEAFDAWLENNVDEIPRVENRINFFEPVPSVARFVFEIKERGDASLQSAFLQRICTKVIVCFERTFGILGYKNTGMEEPSNWCFADASDGMTSAIRAYSQTVKLTEPARMEIITALVEDLDFKNNLDPLYDFDFRSFAETGSPVVMVKCVDANVPECTNAPVRNASVQRVLSGEPFTFDDFCSTGDFFEDGAERLSAADLAKFSLDPRFVPGDVLDTRTRVNDRNEPVKQWLVDAVAEYNALGHGPLDAVKHLVGVVSEYSNGDQLAKLKAPGAKCAAGIAHNPAALIEFRCDAGGAVTVTCCGPQRGGSNDLKVIDANGARLRGETRSRAACAGVCCRTSMSDAKMLDMFLRAETIDVLPSGKLPVLDSELRQILRVRFNKQRAHVFVLTHVPGSGKTQHMMILAIVAHVLAMRQSYKRISVIVTAPTRTLSKALWCDIDAALKNSGAHTDCIYYEDLTESWKGDGVLVSCAHSLPKFAENLPKFQLAFHDEIDQSLESVTNLKREDLGRVMNGMVHAETVVFADANAGDRVRVALKHMRVPDNKVIVLDTPAIRPFRGAQTNIIIPVKSHGVVAKNAALFFALKWCKRGKNTLFVTPTVFEARLMEQLARDHGIKVVALHSKKSELSDEIICMFKNSR